MKKFVLFAALSAAATAMNAQCNKLFISEYVEGYGNNRAVEIYNPTSATINLSGYYIGRFRDGATTFTPIDLPAVDLAPGDVYVAAVDKRDMAGTGLETPLWNGYESLDANGFVLYDSLNNNEPIRGNVYTDTLDLQGRADGFFCPIYNTNSAMYWNGDDGVALIQGNNGQNLPDGSNILDVVGVIGIDPGTSWVDFNNRFLTADRTLVRKANVETGMFTVSPDTFHYNQWTRYAKNSFKHLGSHTCNCRPNSTTSVQNDLLVRLFPNPATTGSVVTIEAAEAVESFTLVNTLGQNVSSQIVNASTRNVTLTLTDVPAGVYILTVNYDGNRQSVSKVVVQ